MQKKSFVPKQLRPSRSNRQWLWLSLLIIVVDQVTKQMVVNRLALYERVAVTDWLNLTYVRNTGAAFSMFSDMPPWVFILLGVAVSVGVVWWLRRHPHDESLVAVGLCLIVGGALGNVIDRATRSYVVDFVDFHIGDWHYAAFNVADIAISLGAACLVLDMLIPRRTPAQGDGRGGGDGSDADSTAGGTAP